MTTTAKIIGGPGTGKTTRLLEIMEKILGTDVRDPTRIGFVSFTRAARAEAAGRAADKFGMRREELESGGWFRTLHSCCYKMLGVAKEQLIAGGKKDAEWMRAATGEDVSPIQVGGEDWQDLFGADTDAGKSLFIWSLARNRLWSLDAAYDQCARSQEMPSRAFVRRLVERYEDAKRKEDRMDFTDLLARVGGVDLTPYGPIDQSPQGLEPMLPVWFADEWQDCSPLQEKVFRRLTSGAKWVYLVGDPFQCQPEGTLVKTANGYKTIEKLNPKTDRLIAFSKRDGRFYGAGKRLKFKIASRIVDSAEIIEIEMEDGTIHQCTENHKWFTRLRRRERFATYLMKRGERWRIGTVQMFGAGKKCSGDFRLKMRMAQEGAESVWILKIFDDDRDARAYEQIASCRYGIPQTTFRPPCGIYTNLTQIFIDTVFSSLGDLTGNGLRCLIAHGLRPEFPFSEKGDFSRNSENVCRTTHACNLLPGLSLLPKLNNDSFEDKRRGKKAGVVRTKELANRRTLTNRVHWIPIKSIRRLPPGRKIRVYSMDVEKFHSYVTNEYATSNSIFTYAGSDPSIFMNWEHSPGAYQVLDKSYRCPRAVWETGESVMKKSTEYFDRGIAPADEEGVLQYGKLQRVIPRIDPAQEWLILARTHWMLAQVCAELESAGTPFAITARGWTPPKWLRGVAALVRLADGQEIGLEHWKAALDVIPAKANGVELLTRGTKTRFKKGGCPSVQKEENDGLFADEEPPTPAAFDVCRLHDLKSHGATDDFIERMRRTDWPDFLPEREKKGAKRIVARGEEQALNPRCRVGTIHSAKGAEADHVLLLDAVTRKIEDNMAGGGRNDECRVFYVGATRARKRLVVATHDRLPPFGVPMSRATEFKGDEYFETAKPVAAPLEPWDEDWQRWENTGTSVHDEGREF